MFNVIDQIQELSPCAAVRYRIRRILKQDLTLNCLLNSIIASGLNY